MKIPNPKYGDHPSEPKYFNLSEFAEKLTELRAEVIRNQSPVNQETTQGNNIYVGLGDLAVSIFCSVCVICLTVIFLNG